MAACTKCRTLRHRRLDRDFPRFGPVLEARKLLALGALGDCPYMLVSMRHLLRECLPRCYTARALRCGMRHIVMSNSII